ncbi:alpha/beta hydrolase [Culicoidibacter larvae]|uniref:Alpha/beta hydrolase n=2 Tax=Culicoidibacter larvae TaxID=2579976 RepID=A0A5R8Q9M4_9FIRM|nr:alpha/beta hydrolase [Culicoidibacter larvae]
MLGRTSKLLDCSEVSVQRSDGSLLRLCVYKSLQGAQGVPGVLWIHGGGYATGVPEMDLSYYQMLVEQHNCVIVAPDYTLSIDKPYPAAIDDCYLALLWMKQHADELGVNDEQLFIIGRSAGGGLTAALTMLARDRGEVNVAFQMPMYPMLDDGNDSASAQDNTAPVWDARSNELAWKLYLGEAYGADRVPPPYAAPARADDYRNLPPTYTFVGTIEPFYDETLQYIADLQQAGVEATVDTYEGCYHAFDQLCANTEIGKLATKRWLEQYKYAAEHYFAPQFTDEK